MQRPRMSARLGRPHLPSPVMRMLHAVGLPAGEIARYWGREARSIRAATAALLVGLLATLVAGAVLGGAGGLLEANPGLLVLIPAAIGMRGSLFGALAARLGTGALTGQVDDEFTRDSFVGRQATATTLLTVSTAAEAGLIAWLVSILLSRPVMGLLDLVAVSVIGGLLASAVLLVVTVAMARWSRSARWSMDDVGAPTITATGDLVTLPALFLATSLLGLAHLGTVVGVVGLVAGVTTAILGSRDADDTIRRVVRESLVVLTVAVMIDVLAGVVMDTRLDSLLSNPALLVMIPPFVAASGSLGGMLASRLASKLHMGLLEPGLWPGRVGGLDISMSYLLSLLAFTGVGTVGWVAALVAGLSPPPMWQLLVVAHVGGLMATTISTVVAYVAAVATFTFGLDPDNHAIPIVTASMDLFGILCLVAAIAMIGL